MDYAALMQLLGQGQPRNPTQMGMLPAGPDPRGFTNQVPQFNAMEDPMTLGLLNAGSAMLGANGNFGQALGQGLQGFGLGAAQAGQMQGQRQQRELQNALMGREIEQQNSQQAGQEVRAAALQRVQQALAQGQEPSPGDLFTVDPEGYAQSMRPKPKEDFTLGNARYTYGPDGKAQLIAQGPQAPREDPLVAVQTPEGPKLVPRSQAAGMAPAQTGSDNEPMVEVYDPTSPTGTKYVPRSQASGMPGKPPGGGFSMDYDDQGRPIIRMGGRLTDFQEGKGGGQVATPGGKADQINPGEAGTLAGRATGADALATVREQLLAPDGSVNRMLLGNMEVPLPWTPGRTANQAYDEAVESKLRALTGAAATQTEFDRLLSMTKPSFFDSDEAVKAKTQRLDKFLSLSGRRNFSDILNVVEGKAPREGSVGDVPTVTTPEEAQALQPGTKFKGPDGVVRIR